MNVTSTPLALPAADTAGALGRPTMMVLLGCDSAPGPLSFSVRALRNSSDGGQEGSGTSQHLASFNTACMPVTFKTEPTHPTHTNFTRRGVGRSPAPSLTLTWCGSVLVPAPLSMQSGAASVQETDTSLQSPVAAVGSTVSMRSCSLGWAVPATSRRTALLTTVRPLGRASQEVPGYV